MKNNNFIEIIILQNNNKDRIMSLKGEEYEYCPRFFKNA
jgi:hypothetical protein